MADDSSPGSIVGKLRTIAPDGCGLGAPRSSALCNRVA